jgi:hypothetical protein
MLTINTSSLTLALQSTAGLLKNERATGYKACLLADYQADYQADYLGIVSRWLRLP